MERQDKSKTDGLSVRLVRAVRRLVLTGVLLVPVGAGAQTAMLQYPYPFMGMRIAEVLKIVEHFQGQPQTFNDEYTIIRDGQEIPIFSSRRGLEPDSYEIMRPGAGGTVGNFMAGSDGRVYKYKLGPDLVNVLFKAGKLTAPQFAQKFARQHRIPAWETKKMYNRTYWQYTDRKGGYRITIFDDKSLAVEPTTP